MFRKTFIAGFAFLAALAVLALAGPVMASGGYWFGFEQDLKPWVPGLDNATKDYSFERVVGENGCYDMLGNAYASLKYVPAGDTSAAWIAANFDGTGSDSVDVTFRAKNAGECRDCKPVLYVGAEAPLKAAQFVDAGTPPATSAFSALIIPGRITPTWQTYHYATGIAGANTIYVALGVRGLSDAMRVKQTASVGLDCVFVNITSNTLK